MQFVPTEFFVGFFLMNAMPHMLFGLLGIRFFSLFGFSAQGNLAYAFLNVVVALVLFHFQYGIQALISNGIVIGACTMLLIYLLTGRFFYSLFQQNNLRS